MTPAAKFIARVRTIASATCGYTTVDMDPKGGRLVCGLQMDFYTTARILDQGRKSQNIRGRASKDYILADSVKNREMLH